MNDEMKEKIKANVKAHNTWVRGAYMLLFALIYGIAEVVVVAVVFFQFFNVLFTGSVNQRLLAFSRELNQFVYQILQFVTYNVEDKPFPFGDWPESGGSTNSAGSAPERKSPVRKKSAASSADSRSSKSGEKPVDGSSEQ